MSAIVESVSLASTLEIKDSLTLKSLSYSRAGRAAWQEEGDELRPFAWAPRAAAPVVSFV